MLLTAVTELRAISWGVNVFGDEVTLVETGFNESPETVEAAAVDVGVVTAGIELLPQPDRRIVTAIIKVSSTKTRVFFIFIYHSPYFFPTRLKTNRI
jgi:hypothetical protein